jgi:DNA sulfur modification protein DndE
MSIKPVKVSTQAKEQLIRLKAPTGIAHRNVLRRWAFCLSPRQPAPPAAIDVAADSNVEMTWPVIGGEAHELYLALLKQRCAQVGLGTSEDVLARQFRLQLHRGIAYLAAPHAIRSIAQLVQLALGEDAQKG